MLSGGRPVAKVRAFTRQDLCAELKLELGSIKDAQDVVRAYFDEIERELSNGSNVTIHNFGRFVPLAKKERVGRNPLTGESKMISARAVATFKPSIRLRNMARLLHDPSYGDGEDGS